MKNRTPFPGVFWAANSIEILERFAYYGIYFGFGIYMEHLGYSMGQLGFIQSVFLFISYVIPVVSGTLADKYGFKRVLIISYLAYLPSILLLIITKSFSGIALTMLSIGFAAGIFKPLISGTVRIVTDKTNKTMGFGIFYAMVNVGASFGPIVAGKLRAISWNYAFYAAAISIAFMFIITILFYKEPDRKIEGITLGKKLQEIYTVLSDLKFAVFLILIGLIFWLPLWCFFNLLAIYVDKNIDTARLYLDIKSVLGISVANFISHEDEAGVRRILGETISHSGYIIVIFQILISRIFEKFRALPSFIFGLLVTALGFVFLGLSRVLDPSLVFLGIVLFAFGEMISSPRIQEYITWIAPKEKAGLYMGTNFLAMGLGAGLSGIIYTSLYGYFRNLNHPEYVWFILAIHLIIGMIILSLFVKKAGEFQELDE